jgi:DNA-binding transcriptional MerR regulator
MASGTFTIGEAASRAGVSADTIRHYERAGVLPRAPRSDGGYRCYTEASVAAICFARNAIRAGFGIRELAGFLKARDAGRPPCHSVRAAGDRILRGLDQQIADLTIARAAMAQTLAAWDARIRATPAGKPAHLLSTLPKTTTGSRARAGLKRQPPEPLHLKRR